MFVKYWSVSSQEFDKIAAAFETVNAEYTVNYDDHGNVEEIQSSNDGIVLVRVLGILGALIGKKADQDFTLPAYLEGAPNDIRHDFARAYIGDRDVGTGEQFITISTGATRRLDLETEYLV